MTDPDQLFSEDTRSFFRSPVRDIFKKVDLGSIYSFAGGYPSADAFPLADIRELSAFVLDRYGASALQYGATQGITPLREVLAARYGLPLERIQITTSSQQGIDVCARVLIDPGDVILTSRPTYLGALQSFASYRAEVVGVDPDAPRQAWQQTVRDIRARGKRLKFLYMIPDFQNPSGETLSLEMRRFLTGLAREEGFYIVEDSPYRELRYEGEDLPTMLSLAPECVIHLGSFSKVFAPGFRLGWMSAPPEVLDRVYVCKQSLDLCPPVFDQHLAAEYVRSGRMDANLARIREMYRAKRDLMLSCLAQEMPEGVSWTRPEGGLFLFLKLWEGFDSVAFYDRALAAGVAYVAGSFFYPGGREGRHTMRLNFSFMTPERIREGLALLGRLLKEAKQEQSC